MSHVHIEVHSSKLHGVPYEYIFFNIIHDSESDSSLFMFISVFLRKGGVPTRYTD